MSPMIPPSTIPRRLIFTYKTNLLTTQQPQLLHDNVQDTIAMYRQEWARRDELEQRQRQDTSWGDNNDDHEPTLVDVVDDDNNNKEEDSDVWFLDNNDCRQVLHRVKPALERFFLAETSGSFKSDLCRVAALYEQGGYYMDIDMKAVRPFVIDSVKRHVPSTPIGFVTVAMTTGNAFFQSFLAAEPKSGILEKALDKMLDFYQEKEQVTQAALQLIKQPNWWTTPFNMTTLPLQALTVSEDKERHGAAFVSAMETLRKAAIQAPEFRTGQVVKLSIETYVDTYHSQCRIGGGLMGPVLLYQAYVEAREERLQHRVKSQGLESQLGPLEDSVFVLHEVNLDHVPQRFTAIPPQDGDGDYCNYVVFDKADDVVYFYSRLVGASDKCLFPGHDSGAMDQ